MSTTPKLGFLDRYLTLWIALAMLLGLGAGYFFPALPSTMEAVSLGDTNVLIGMGLIAMLYPPLVRVDYAKIHTVFADWKLLGLSLLQNWVIGPLLMFGLAVLFLPQHWPYATGLILIGIARCIAMVLVWNDLAGGNRQYAAALVGFNALFQIIFYTAFVYLFLTYLPGLLGLQQAQVQVSTSQVAANVGTYLGIPFVLALGSRYALLAWRGSAWFHGRFLPAIGPVTLVALLFTIVILFSMQGNRIVQQPGDVLLIALPLSLYFVIMFVLAFWLSRAAGYGYENSTALAFTAAGNNFELGIAIAIGVFGVHSAVAFATTIGPLLEVPVLLAMVRLARWWQPSVERATAARSAPQ